MVHKTECLAHEKILIILLKTSEEEAEGCTAPLKVDMASIDREKLVEIQASDTALVRCRKSLQESKENKYFVFTKAGVHYGQITTRGESIITSSCTGMSNGKNIEPCT